MRSAFVAAFIIVILVATPQAQQPVAFRGSPGAIIAGSPAAVPSSPTAVDLLVGRSTILNVANPIARVSLTVPDIADAMVTSPQQLLIHGKTPGTISLFVWDRAGGIRTYEVNVRRDLSQLIEQMKQLFPGEPITVTGSGKDVVISGTVSSKYVIDKAADVAGGYVEKKENVVNLLKQQEGVASNQVLLRVRFAEVSRSALQELGVNLHRQWLQERLVRPHHDAAVRRARLRFVEARRPDVQRLPQRLPLQLEAQHRRGDQGAAVEGPVREPGRAEPDRQQRQGGQLPRRR